MSLPWGVGNEILECGAAALIICRAADEPAVLITEFGLMKENFGQPVLIVDLISH
jgi:hypothetical protein